MPIFDDYFQRAFNQGLGRATGRPISVPKQVILPYKPRQQQRQAVRRIAQGITDLSTNVENNYENMFGEAAVGGGDSSLQQVQRDIDTKARQAARRLQRQEDENLAELYQNPAVIAETERINAAAEQQKAAGIQDAFDKPSNPLDWFAEEVKDKLKYLDRPMQAVSGFMMEGVEREEGKSDKLDIIGGLKGAVAGFTGKKQWDFGKDVVEEYFPDVPHPVKIALGVGGNVGLDPLNLVGVGAAKYATRTGKILKDASFADEMAGIAAKAVTETGVSTGKKTVAEVTKKMGENALERTQRTILNIKRGGVRNRLNVGSREALAATQGAQAAEDFRKLRLGTFEDMLNIFRRHIESVSQGGPKVLSDWEIKVMKHADDDFRTFHDNLFPKGNAPSQWKTAMDEGAEKIRGGVGKDVQAIQDNIQKAVQGSYKHGIAVRLGPKQIKVPFLGKALGITEKGIGKYLDLDRIKELSHAGMFPGKVGLLIQRGRAHGMEYSENFKNEVADFAKVYDKNQRREITHAIDNNLDFPHDPHLQAGKDFVQTKFKELYDREVDFGARNPDTSPFLDNYTFIWNKRGNSRTLEKFKDARKKQINNGKGAGTFKVADAKAQGLAPVEDVFDMLARRQLKSNRDITRALLRSDLLENYGVVARGLNKSEVTSRNLVPIANEGITSNLRAHADKVAGDSWYLHDEYKKVLDHFDDLSRVTADPTVMRGIRKITNFFKSSVTVYNPGYHTRNAISDFIMGLMDGVGIKPYLDLMNPAKVSIERVPGKRLPRVMPKAGATIKIGRGWTMTMHELWALFKANASGAGFISSDIGRNVAGRTLSRANQGVRRASEVREDFGRVAHFLGALRQEYKYSPRNMTRDMAQQKAMEQAVYRVNHYKFDYGALTKWEQQKVKPIVPFYTFTRKAFPAVIENYMMNPKWIHRQQLLSPDGDENKNFETWALHPWMRETGYATVQDEKEPWLYSYEGTPFSIPGNVIPGDKSAQEFARTGLSQINPLAQMGIEILNKKEIFTGQKITDYKEYIKNKFGGPYAQVGKAQEASERGLTPLQIGLTSRLGLGLPLRKVSTEQQDFQKKLWEDKNIEAPFDEFNEGPGAASGIRIYTSKSKSTGNSSYKIRDTKTGREIYSGTDPFKAIEVAQQQRGTTALPASINVGGEEVPFSLTEWNRNVGAQGNIKVYWSDRKKGSSYRVKNTRNNRVIGDYQDISTAFQIANSRAAVNRFGG